MDAEHSGCPWMTGTYKEGSTGGNSKKKKRRMSECKDRTLMQSTSNGWERQNLYSAKEGGVFGCQAKAFKCNRKVKNCSNLNKPVDAAAASYKYLLIEISFCGCSHEEFHFSGRQGIRILKGSTASRRRTSRLLGLL